MPAMWLAGGAALGAGGSIFSSIMGASGASKQAGAIRDAATIGSQTALTLNDRSRADLAPYRDAGASATGSLLDLLTGKTNISDATQASPLYQYQQQLGTRDINRNLASRGLYGSGAGLQTLNLFTQGLVANEANNLYGRLFGVSQMGENAAAQTASNNTSTGGTVAGIQANAGVNAGQATANQYQAYGGMGPGVANAFRGYVGDSLNYQLYNNIFGLNPGGGTSAPGIPYSGVNVRGAGGQPGYDVATFN